MGRRATSELGAHSLIRFSNVDGLHPFDDVYRGPIGRLFTRLIRREECPQALSVKRVPLDVGA